ncbi:DUF3887 domain-containing protein [Riemerella columbina]|uniref:DUF3887 domain-containing protein n=1 Tax=Riemerella columbina TaxID=103810 RepID=UPI0003A68740|nr:DUF3887 domain-containing protein [Riemerella columbina]
MRCLLVFVCVTMFSVFGFAQSQEALGRECIYNLFQTQDYKKVTTYFNDEFKKELTESKLSQTDLLVQKLGEYKGIIEVNKDDKGLYYYYVRFENQSLDAIIEFDKNKKISGLVLSSKHRDFKLKK